MGGGSSIPTITPAKSPAEYAKAAAVQGPNKAAAAVSSTILTSGMGDYSQASIGKKQALG